MTLALILLARLYGVWSICWLGRFVEFGQTPGELVKVWTGEFVHPAGRSVIDERLVHELARIEFVDSPVDEEPFVVLASPPRMIVGPAAAAPVTPIIAARTENARTEERPMMI